MKIRIELSDSDIAAAIKAYVLEKMGMAVTSEVVTITGTADDRNGPMRYTASVMAEPAAKTRQSYEDGGR